MSQRKDAFRLYANRLMKGSIAYETNINPAIEEWVMAQPVPARTFPQFTRQQIEVEHSICWANFRIAYDRNHMGDA